MAPLSAAILKFWFGDMVGRIRLHQMTLVQKGFFSPFRSAFGYDLSKELALMARISEGY